MIDTPSSSIRRWSPERVARLGFLVGQGWDARRIATDSLIASTPLNVHRQARRFGLAFRATGGIPLPCPVLDTFDAAAARRRISREGLMRTLLVAAGSRQGLIDTILDTRR